jgi:TonB family protein
MQQATQALAHADEVRAAEARALAAVAPVEAAMQADEDAAAKAADAQEQADHEVIAAQQALVASTAQLAAAERQVERAAARAQLDPDDWVHLPAPSGTPADAGDPAEPGTPGARPDAPGGSPPVDLGHVASALPVRTPEPPTEAQPSALTTAVASALAALTFVRTDGDAAAVWDPNARLIGTSSLHAAVMSRSLTDVTPVKTVSPAPALQGSPDQAHDGHSGADAARLAPLRSDGPAPDGFVLTLLDAPRALPRIAAARTDPADAEEAVTEPDPVEPDELPLIDPLDPEATVSVAPEDIPQGAVTRLSVSGHPLATWMNGVDETLRRGWDYPLEARALGIHGTVEVRFTVLPSGRVTDVTVTMADAPPELVNAATGSIPARVKPPGEELEIRYTFRYRLASGA